MSVDTPAPPSDEAKPTDETPWTEARALARLQLLDRCEQAWSDNDLLTVCMALRMQHSGSCDPMPPEDVAEWCECLRLRLEFWRPSLHPKWGRFDNAVRDVVRATLAEVCDAG